MNWNADWSSNSTGKPKPPQAKPPAQERKANGDDVRMTEFNGDAEEIEAFIKAQEGSPALHATLSVTPDGGSLYFVFEPALMQQPKEVQQSAIMQLCFTAMSMLAAQLPTKASKLAEHAAKAIRSCEAELAKSFES